MRAKEFIREQGPRIPGPVGGAIRGIGAVKGAVKAARGIKWTPELKDRLKDLYNQGHPVEDIAQKLSKETGKDFTKNAINSQVIKLNLTRNQWGVVLNKRLAAQGGHLPFRGKTFSEILKHGSFNISGIGVGGGGLATRQFSAFSEWLDTQILPTPQGKQLFDRMVALDKKMLQANHIRSRTTGSVVINRTTYPKDKNKPTYKWGEIDEVSTVTKEELTALHGEYKQIMYELGQLVRNNFRLRTRLGRMGAAGFGFLPQDRRWPATTKLDTYENWRKAQQQFFPRFVEQMNELEDQVNRLASAKGINVGRFNIINKIKKLGDPPDLVGKLRELQTTFVNIRIKAGADLTKLRLSPWQLAEHKAVKSFENLSVFKSGGWNIAHAGTTTSKIDIHFLLNNVVVGGAEVKKRWGAHYGTQVIKIARDKTGVVKIGKPRIPTALSDFGQKLLADTLDSEKLDDIVKRLQDIKTGTIVQTNLSGTIDVSKYVRDFYSKKDQGRATFLVVGDEIFRLADEIPQALRNFPGMNRMSGIEGMQGKIILFSSIDSRRRIVHKIAIEGKKKQNINSVKLNDLQ